jgi:hypothetical protein
MTCLRTWAAEGKRSKYTRKGLVSSAICISAFFAIATNADATHRLSLRCLGPSCGRHVHVPAIAPYHKSLKVLYAKSVYDAAVKRKNFQVPLTAIDLSKPARVATFATDKFPPVDRTTNTLVKETWVSLVPFVQEICHKRRGDPVLVIEQILGMPPRGDSGEHGKWMMYEFTVEPSHIFRPCVSSHSIVTRNCGFASPETLDAETAFVLEQMWAAETVGVQGPGYPFTGMGWTYDWGPQAPPNHVGVSEYVIHKGAPVMEIGRAVAPEVLCSSRPKSR